MDETMIEFLAFETFTKLLLDDLNNNHPANESVNERRDLVGTLKRIQHWKELRADEKSILSDKIRE